MSNFKPRSVECQECGRSFEFSAEEQEFYNERGFSEPKRCPECRAERKVRTHKRGGGGQKEMHNAVCSACGCETQVPFKPTGDRPVFCSDCYKKQQQQY